MKLVELSELQFNNYSKYHSKRNYFQTIEYARMYEKKGYKKIFLGLSDDTNIYAATLLLTKKVFLNYSFAYAPKGFLIDFDDTKLLTEFTALLKLFAKRKKIAYITLYPNVIYKKFDQDNSLVYYNNNLIKNIKEIGYTHQGFYNQFKNNHSRFEVVLEVSNKKINSLFDAFSRSIQRNIKNNMNMGITIYQGKNDDLEMFYRMIAKKTTNTLDYYQSYLDFFTSNNNSFEIYFAKLNPKIYLDNYTYLLNQERAHNEILNKKIQRIKANKKYLNKKMESDKIINKYEKQIVNATNIWKKYPDGLMISTCAIIKNNKEIYFLIDGYEEKFKKIYSTALLKWEIMKKYLKNGYNLFNLGEVAGVFTKNNKYYRHYLSKIGFNAETYEYPGEYYLVTNKVIYYLYDKLFLNVKKDIKAKKKLRK